MTYSWHGTAVAVSLILQLFPRFGRFPKFTKYTNLSASAMPLSKFADRTPFNVIVFIAVYMVPGLNI